MAYPGAPKDGKSDVDRPFLPERQGEAKKGFDNAQKAEPQKAAQADRGSGNQGQVPDSIKKHQPGVNFDMKGGGQIKAAGARQRLSKEASEERAMQTAMAVSKKMEKSGGIDQDKSKNQGKGRE